MSAFVVSDRHLSAIVTHVWRMKWHLDGWAPAEDHAELVRVANLLRAENVRSVQHRYPGHDYQAELATDVELMPVAKSSTPLSNAQFLKLLECYDYQSCETEDYYSTVAARIIRNLRSQAVATLDGYAQSEWAL